MIRLLVMIISLIMVFGHTNASAENLKRVAIIIDDFGGNVKGIDSFLTGGIPITVAIMPFMEYSTEQAKQAHEAGLEVMIHMPMEPKKGKASWLGPNAIISGLSDQEIRRRVEQAIENVPHAKGLNNHMGSKIVENEHMMRIILEVVKEHGLYVVDSGTSSNSVIPKLATELNIPYATRSIFLDNTMSSKQHVSNQMRSLMTLAEKNKKAIGIGHVGVKGHETFAGIISALPQYKQKQVQIVPVSQLLDSEVDTNFEHFWKPHKERMRINDPEHD
ncbi:divergent polysaccharide deacetylase family protein [bacterium LRH843]|nr:divergent polysaccharide deacetylase family protein [bacterium LRH843]